MTPRTPAVEWFRPFVDTPVRDLAGAQSAAITVADACGLGVVDLIRPGGRLDHVARINVTVTQDRLGAGGGPPTLTAMADMGRAQ